MKYAIILLAGLIIRIALPAQPGSAAFSDLVFKNDAERKIFDELEQQADRLQLFLISGSDLSAGEINDIQAKIGQFIASPDVAKLRSGYNSKSLKKLYKDVHDYFFVKYTDNPAFDKIFKTGEYNCATASALYSLVLDKLSVKYTIRETPTHVYLIASPGNGDVIFETTAPGSVSIELNDKLKSQFLDYMYENKLIPKDEWQSAGKDKLFEKYFYDDNPVDSKQLGGILYFNRGVELITGEKYKEAYTAFEKAYLLYPCDKIRYFITIVLANIIMKSDRAGDSKDLQYYLRFAEIGNKELGNKLISDFIDESGKEYLFKKQQPHIYSALYRATTGAIKDTIAVKDIRHVYYYHMAHYFDIRNKYDSAKIYLDSVYSLSQNDLLVQELLTSVIFNELQTLHDVDHTADSVQYYFAKYPFLQSNIRLREFYVYCLSKETADALKKEKKAEADKYLAIIKPFLINEPSLVKKTGSYLTGAFLEVYYYHVRHKQYKEAKAFLLEIDKYMPDNEEIKLRLKRIDDILKANK